MKSFVNICVLIVSVIAPMACGAYNFEKDGIFYSLAESYYYDNCVKVVRGNVEYGGDVVIPEKVSYGGKKYVVCKIDESAFVGCKDLTSLKLPKKMEGVYTDYFDGCDNLTTINVDKGNKRIMSIDGVVFSYNDDKIPSQLSCFPPGKKGEYIIPSMVTRLLDVSFRNCKGITSIIIQSLVDDIPSYGGSPFDGCENLKEIRVSADNKLYGSIGGVLFCKNDGVCNYLQRCPEGKAGDYVMPNVLGCATSAFSGCDKLTSITLSDELNFIGFVDIASNYPYARTTGLFHDCKRLTSIRVSDRSLNFLTKEGVLFSKDGLMLLDFPPGKKGVYIIPDGVRRVCTESFKGSGVTMIEVPKSMEKIGDKAFSECADLISLKIPQDVEIGKGALIGCCGLSTVEIYGSNLKTGMLRFENGVLYSEYGSNVFYCLANKEDGFVIPNKVRTISMGAFADCKKIKSLTLSSNVKGFPFNAFSSTLENLYCHEQNQTFTSENGLLFSKDKFLLVYCPRGKAGTLEIPMSVTSISENAFDGCVGLTSVVLPESVTNIGSYAFYGCLGLDSIHIPESVSEIGDKAFAGCWGLKMIKFPAELYSTDRLGDDVFPEGTPVKFY